jgi:phosphatidate cytidylyltransferase
LISFILVFGALVLCTINIAQFGHYGYHIRQWAISILSILIICGLAVSYTFLIYQGMFWYLFSAMSVIVNDMMAYLFGFYFGTHPLIKLSPKKTWEGFIGGAIGSAIWAFYSS